MKQLYLLLLLLAAFSCTENQNNTPPIFVGLLIDRTDTFKEVRDFESNSIFKLTGLDITPERSIHFHVASISDTRYNLQYKEYLESAPSALENNEIERLEIIDSFKIKVRHDIEKICSQPIGLNGSSVFHALSEMINQASKASPEGEKTIVVLSDMAEFTSDFNALRIENLQAYKKDPERFYQFMEKLYPIAPSKHMKVYLIHQVKDKIDDTRFFIVSNLIKGYLNCKGIEVETGSNLNL